MQLLPCRVAFDDEVVPFVLEPVWTSTRESRDLRAMHSDHDTPKIEGRLKFACLTGWNIASIAGKDVADSGLGRWARSQATGNKSSGLSSSPVTGHRFSDACNAFSIKRRSKRWPVFRLTTGCWGTSPEMAQYILALVS